jgi:hypothetical protein
MKTNIHLLIISRSVLLRMRNVFDKYCRENQNTYFVFNNFVFFFEIRAVYEIMWKLQEREISLLTGSKQYFIRARK